MVLIAWTLSLLWFSHSRTVAPPVNPSPPTSNAPANLVTIAVHRPRNLPDSVAEEMVCEAADIWRPLGVELQESWSDDAKATSAVRVVVEDRDGGTNRASLGWVRFNGPGDPESVIHVSYPAVARYLDTKERGRQVSPRRRSVLLARMLGRVLAHELGHYLLRAPGHSVHGLMRATWSVDALTAVDAAGFGLTLDDVSELQAAVTGHSTAS